MVSSRVRMGVHFGEHITIDGYEGSPKLLDDEVVVQSALNEICTLLKMHPLNKPVVVGAPDNHIKDPGGWSGFVIIAESHISIHTFPKRRFLSADVYTCRNGVDQNIVIDFFRNKFNLGEVETHFVKRGVKYPQQNLV